MVCGKVNIIETANNILASKLKKSFFLFPKIVSEQKVLKELLLLLPT